MSRCIRCIVSGRVQGVWYRATAQRFAQELGITGHARNLPDGRVEVLACGGESALAAFRFRLREGPPAARVDELTCEPASGPTPGEFLTL